MNIIWADMLMYVGRVVFRGIITQVFLPGLVVKFEVLLCFTVEKPEVPHLYCLGALSFDGIVDNADGGSVVNVNWYRQLWVSEFGKSETGDLGFLSVEKEGTQFGFGHRCSNKFEYCACDVDGAVEFDRIAVNRETAKKEVATSAASCTGGGAIRCIVMDVEGHVQGTVSYDGVGVHQHVVEELLYPFLGVFGWRRLLRGNVGKIHEDGWVASSSIVEETANYLLDLHFAGIVQEGTLVGGIGCLVILAVCDWIGCKRAMLGFERHGVSITGKLLHDVFGHGEVNISLGVIPLEGDATI